MYPTIDFGDVGGTARVKQEIRLIAENRFSIIPSTIVRNGILLYGPQGTGKNLLAEATAGEYRVNFHRLQMSRATKPVHRNNEHQNPPGL